MGAAQLDQVADLGVAGASLFVEMAVGTARGDQVRLIGGQSFQS